MLDCRGVRLDVASIGRRPSSKAPRFPWPQRGENPKTRGESKPGRSPCKSAIELCAGSQDMGLSSARRNRCVKAYSNVRSLFHSCNLLHTSRSYSLTGNSRLYRFIHISIHFFPSWIRFTAGTPVARHPARSSMASRLRGIRRHRPDMFATSTTGDSTEKTILD